MFTLKAAFGCCLLAIPYSAWALFGDSIQPYVSYSISRDSNYFRVASPDQAQALLGTTDTAVTTQNVLVGVDANLKFSRQMVLLRVNLVVLLLVVWSSIAYEITSLI